MWDKDCAVVACSEDVASDEYLGLASRLLGAVDTEMQTWVGKDIEVVEYLAHVVQVVGMEDGELKTMLRLAMVLRDGATTATCSPSFIRTFAWLAKRFKPATADAGMPIRVGKSRSRTGKDYFTCALAPKALESNGQNEKPAKPKR